MSRLRKGGSVSIWIWIIGGLVVGVVTFTVAFTQLGHLWDQSMRQDIVTNYENLNDEVQMACGYSVGTKTEFTIDLIDVRAIFASDTRGEASHYAPNNVTQGDTGEGEYLCLTFYDDHYRCENHYCDVNMTYIGDPLEDSQMYNMGIQDGKFTYELEIEKTDNRLVEVRAEHIP